MILVPVSVYYRLFDHINVKINYIILRTLEWMVMIRTVLQNPSEDCEEEH
jgi:hypothetical protein